MHIRDEAHRFGITFHRHKRSLAFIKSELSRFRVWEASPSPNCCVGQDGKCHPKVLGGAVAETIGLSRAKAVKAFYEKKETSDSQNRSVSPEEDPSAPHLQVVVNK